MRILKIYGSNCNFLVSVISNFSAHRMIFLPYKVLSSSKIYFERALYKVSSRELHGFVS